MVGLENASTSLVAIIQRSDTPPQPRISSSVNQLRPCTPSPLAAITHDKRPLEASPSDSLTEDHEEEFKRRCLGFEENIRILTEERNALKSRNEVLVASNMELLAANEDLRIQLASQGAHLATLTKETKEWQHQYDARLREVEQNQRVPLQPIRRNQPQTVLGLATNQMSRLDRSTSEVPLCAATPSTSGSPNHDDNGRQDHDSIEHVSQTASVQEIVDQVEDSNTERRNWVDKPGTSPSSQTSKRLSYSEAVKQLRIPEESKRAAMAAL